MLYDRRIYSIDSKQMTSLNLYFIISRFLESAPRHTPKLRYPTKHKKAGNAQPYLTVLPLTASYSKYQEISQVAPGPMRQKTVQAINILSPYVLSIRFDAGKSNDKQKCRLKA